MKLTLMQVLIVAVAAPTMATAQVTPKPAPQPKPAPTQRPKIDLEWELMGPRLDELRMHADEARLHALEMSKADIERLKFAAEDFKMLHQLDVAHIKAQAEEWAHVAKEDWRHLANVDVGDLKFRAEEAARMALLDMPMKFEAPLGLGPMGFGPEGFGPGVGHSDKLLNGRPRAPWAREDPADSLYRVAREALNRGEYRRAAQLFSEVTKKFPKSVYALDSAYWEAFARYRTGSTDDLREALKILEERSAQFESLRNHEGNVDVQALRARVQGALAARGDAKAAEELRKNASQSGTCDREEVSVRAEALSALGQMDIAAAMPVVKKVLQRRDECTVELRRRALYIIARQPNSEAVSLILDVAKNDTNSGIRGEAMRWLPRVAGDEAVPQLEELLKSSTDEQQQRSAVNALASIDSERARRAIRTIIERADAGERVRAEAIVSISRERENRTVSPEELNYLRSLYGRLETPRLKEAVLTSLSRVPTAENQQFLVAIVRNTNESSSLRATALQRLGRMESVNATEIAKLYDVADARALREQILSALSQRKEPEAIDKMIDIAKKDTDPQIRRTAVNLISRAAQGGNERAKKFLQEMFDR
jgi:HEAT repeat protein/TolA-binding protein